MFDLKNAIGNGCFPRMTLEVVALYCSKQQVTSPPPPSPTCIEYYALAFYGNSC